jgi:nucleoside recognition membrane protein YjiH
MAKENKEAFFKRHASEIWKLVSILAFLSFIVVVVQIWYEPFKTDFIWKLFATWSAFIVMLYAVNLAERVIVLEDTSKKK